MIELRWAVPEGTTTDAARLQYRHHPPIVSFGGPAGWTEWQDVPYAVVPPKPAPTVSTVFAHGVGTAQGDSNG